MTKRIAADRRNGEVVWRLAPWEVRDLCDHLEDTLTPRDALLDVPLLRAAADRLDPPPETAP